MNTMKCLYFAGPLFTQGEWMWNMLITEELRSLGLTVILPQEKAASMLNNAELYNTENLFRDNVAGIEQANAVVAIFDQPDPDSGTCWECGYAYKLGCPIIGLRTDIRPAGDDKDRPVNLMMARSCQEFISVPLDKRNDTHWVAQQIIEALNRIKTP